MTSVLDVFSTARAMFGGIALWLFVLFAAIDVLRSKCSIPVISSPELPLPQHSIWQHINHPADFFSLFVFCRQTLFQAHILAALTLASPGFLSFCHSLLANYMWFMPAGTDTHCTFLIHSCVNFSLMHFLNYPCSDLLRCLLVLPFTTLLGFSVHVGNIVFIYGKIYYSSPACLVQASIHKTPKV